MRTRSHHGPSIFSSLGQAFNFHHSSPKYGVVIQHDPRAAKQELLLAELLFSLESSLSTDPRQQLSLRWLHQALTVVASTISGTQALIPGLACPLSESDELWVSKYLEDTCRILDVLNTIRKLLAEFEDRQMLLKLAASTLGSKNAEESYSRARKFIADYAAAAQGITAATSNVVEDCMSVLGEMISQPFEERFGPLLPRTGRSFLSALYGAKVVAVYVLGMIVAALSGGEKIMDWKAPEGFAWSKPLQGLLERVKKKLVRKARFGEEMTTAAVYEFGVLDLEVRSLLSELDHAMAMASSNRQAEKEMTIGASSNRQVEKDSKITASSNRQAENEVEITAPGSDQQQQQQQEEEIESCTKICEGLQAALKNSEEGLEMVRQEIDKLFRVIVSNRNSLLNRMRGSA